MSILSFDTGTNAKLRDSVAKSIYEREYERIVELELQFVPYQLAAYSYELADAFIAAIKRFHKKLWFVTRWSKYGKQFR